MPKDYKIQHGDCIGSIAFDHGFFWETLWNHTQNSKLKSKRKDPNVLKVGDVVHIPDLSIKQESTATDQCHHFKLKGVPAKLKLKLMRPKPEQEEDSDSASDSSSTPGLSAPVPGLPGASSSGNDDDTCDLADPTYQPPDEEEEPVKNAPYIFEADGEQLGEGNTDGEGFVEIPLKPNARAGKLTVYPGKPEEITYSLDLGGLDPVDEVSGVRQRLANLGYFCAHSGPEDSDDLRSALRKFQENNSLRITGMIDDTTKSELKSLHGC